MRHTEEVGEVTLSVTSTDKELRFEVVDTGCGIAAEHHARIFDRFYRVDEARSRRDGGAGLGLVLAKSIVELHRGSITVESAPGAGAIFRVVLPSCRAVAL